MASRGAVALAIVRAAAWFVVLYLIHLPFMLEIGRIPERLRWSERTLLGLALIAGIVAADVALDRAARLGATTRRGTYRFGWLVPAAALALLAGALRLGGRHDEAAVGVSTLVAWSAGFDLRGAVWPVLKRAEPRATAVRTGGRVSASPQKRAARPVRRGAASAARDSRRPLRGEVKSATPRARAGDS